MNKMKKNSLNKFWALCKDRRIKGRENGYENKCRRKERDQK